MIVMWHRHLFSPADLELLPSVTFAATERWLEEVGREGFRLVDRSPSAADKNFMVRNIRMGMYIHQWQIARGVRTLKGV